MKEYCEVCHNTCDHVNKVELGELNRTNVDLCDECFEKVKTDCKSTYQLVGICEDITVTIKDHHEDDHFDKGELYAVHDGIATAFAMSNLSSVGLGKMIHMAAEAEIEKEEIRNKNKDIIQKVVEDILIYDNPPTIGPLPEIYYGKSPISQVIDDVVLGSKGTISFDKYLTHIPGLPKHKPKGTIQSCYVCGNSHTTLRNYGCGDYICQSCYKKRYEVYEG